MDPKLQSSFIPRKSMANIPSYQASSVTVYSIVASIMFVVALGLATVAFISKKTMIDDIVNMNKTLVETRNSFQTEMILDLKNKSYRLTEANSLLKNHLAFSNFFHFVEDTVYEGVTWNDLTYEYNKSGQVRIKLSGLARSFNSLALQYDIFENNPGLSDVALTKIAPDKSGGVSFVAEAVVSRDMILYKAKEVLSVKDEGSLSAEINDIP